MGVDGRKCCRLAGSRGSSGAEVLPVPVVGSSQAEMISVAGLPVVFILLLLIIKKRSGVHAERE